MRMKRSTSVKALLFLSLVIAFSIFATAQTDTEPTVLAKSIETTNPGSWQILGEPGRPVQVRIGTAVITADEVGLLRGPDGIFDWEFHGAVHMKTQRPFRTR